LRLPLRRIAYQSHRIYYESRQDDFVLIVRILHTAQDASAALD
jgi:plasmid stabilization system protein ParE